MGKQTQGKKPIRLYSIIFQRVFLLSIVIVLAGLMAAFYVFYNHFIDEIGKSRLDILKQIASLNQVVKSVTSSVADDLYADLYNEVQSSSFDRMTFEMKMRGRVKATKAVFDRYSMDTSVDVVMSDTGARYSSSTEMSEPSDQLLKSYWYTNLISGVSDKSWSMRIFQSPESESVVLSYGRVLRGTDGRVLCTIIANTSQNMVYKNYSDALRAGNRLYIVDENGIIISHSNPALIGFALYHMEGMEDKLHKSQYSVQKSLNHSMLVSSYYSPDTKWTIIEEVQLYSIVQAYQSVLILMGLFILAGVLLAVALSYTTARIITKPLTLLSERMMENQGEKLEKIQIQNQFYEVRVLSVTYNAMIQRIIKLISQIKEEESEKRRIEFDFLQAQINPHFLHNTLLGIKSLVSLGKQQQAVKMLEAFISLLKQPMKASQNDHSLSEEISHVLQYVSIMQFRYGTEYPILIQVEEGLENFPVPKLILQPLVENAIFHGISEMEGEGKITITAETFRNRIIISVEDNGEGMTQEQIDRMWSSDHSFRSSMNNSIGLANVRSRIRFVYGPSSGIEVQSALGKGTRVSIVIVREEEPYETSDCR
ncbi:MAG: two-component sensor histidine kinase [Bacillota bacterium]|jgi:two-component system sensor histidine kinase YesM|nr:two-component sensor histidine kinase [Bacillota bacterium]